MAASIKSSLELDKVIKAAARLGAQVAESPENLEQSALIWVNAGLQALKSKGGRLISLQTLEELSDLGDGSALAALISLYCPQQINAATIHFGEMTKSMSGKLNPTFHSPSVPNPCCVNGVFRSHWKLANDL